MAQRRMFSRKITESDSFLDMPLSTQVLYFHLNMGADDDGFVGNAKTIKRMIGASDDDLKLLISKEFIFPFDSGVVVIRDWRIHNYIRKDRYNETYYKSEKAMIEVKENNQYKVIDNNNSKCHTNCIPTVDQVSYQMDTQVRIGKDRLELGKDRLATTAAVAENNDVSVTSQDATDKKEIRQEKELDNSSSSSANIQQVLYFYQNNFGVMSPYIHYDLEDWAKTLSPELVIRAMQKASEAGKNYSYAKGILRSWLNNNIRTLEDVDAEETKFQNQIKQKTGYKKPVKQEIEPSWLKESQQQPTAEEADTESEEEIRARLQKVLGSDKS